MCNEVKEVPVYIYFYNAGKLETAFTLYDYNFEKKYFFSLYVFCL